MGLNDVLYDPIRHNNWATGSLIRFCLAQNLTAEQLEMTGVGTYGGILATLDHIVRCDGSYLRRIVDRPVEFVDGEPATDLETLGRWNADLGALWEVFLTQPFDVERVIIVDDNTRGTRAGIFVAQAINHANHHREQVCAILTGMGIEPPDIQAWEYAWETERIWDLPAAAAAE
ncbi:putative damage-inducible protein DinB [Kribbella sp. VKM Ac-2569]|uniref:DinB family protein n=1 Tax=Kribbella sp. VKM Ac-2569 TaxID=2512220 RepID=UPI00102AD0CB|nr:DinB family protein [Kribbella sp. VKM Ac-2569]RZT12602.1 putative damage-inducible protein DinB [Kribbella sp. VKM Ac-2569]